MLDFAISQSLAILYEADLAARGRVGFITANVKTITGHDASSFLGDPDFARDHVHADDRAAYVAAERVLRTAGVARREYRFATKDGRYVWFREELRINRGAAGRGDQLLGCMVDISAQKTAEEKLRDTEALKLAMSDAGLNAVIVLEEGGAILEFSPVAERTFGYRRAAMIGRPITKLIIPQKRQRSRREALRRLGISDTGALGGLVAIGAIRSDGRTFPAEAKVIDVTLSGRRVFVVELWDTTERMRADQERQRLSRLLDDAVQSSPTGVAIYDASGRLTLCNTAYASFFGEDPMSIMGTHASENHRRALAQLQLWNGAPVDMTDQALDASFADLREAAGEPIEMQRKDGQWLQITTRPTSEGGLVFVRTDITRLKQREAELQQAQEILEDAIESLAEGFALYDADDRLVMCNQRYRELNPLSADLLEPGVQWQDFLRRGAERGQYPDAMGQIDAWLEMRAGQRARLETNVEIPQFDGGWHQFSNARTRSGGTVVTRSDITHHKKLQQALRESDERFRRLLEACPVPVTMTRAEDGEVIYESPAAQALFRHDPQAKEPVFAAEHFADPADRMAYVALLRTHDAVNDYQLQLKRTDGALLWVSISARLIDFQDEEVIVASFQDLTERHAVEAELARQRETLHQNEKLGALGSLLAGIAHELNNPLSVVVGQSLLLQETAADEKTANRAAKIGNAADRCSRIVRTFLAMARQQPTKQAAVDINEIVAATLEVTGYSLRTADVDVVLDLADDLPPVWADADQLNQVVTNLIVNAQQAMSDASRSGQLRIASAVDETEGTVLLRIKDSGPGIPTDIQSRIFEPFFTTKKVGAGTGIGLAVCHKIIQALHGEITVESKSGEGAAFTISLPVAVPSDCDAARTNTRECAARSCRVLVIDDEPEVTAMLHDILSRVGHQVTTAESGKHALRLLSRQEFDVILSDLRMPNMDGPQLYATLRSLSPKQLGRVAFITGDTFSPSISTFLKESGRPFVQKPFSPEEIQDLIGRVLASEHVETLKR